VRSDEHQRDREAPARELFLQVASAHAGHRQVQHDAARIGDASRSQKLLGCAEHLRVEAVGSKQRR
jgi:hypothetical protein